MSEFKRLCDEHGLTHTCFWCPSDNPCMMCDDTRKLYPTLEELLDDVEEKWPNDDWELLQDRAGKRYGLTIVNGSRWDPCQGIAHDLVIEAETRKLAVLRALISEGDSDD